MVDNNRVFNIALFLLSLVFLLLFFVGYVPKVHADNFQFLKDIYKTQQAWKAYGNKIQPAYYHISWGGGSYSTNFVNSGSNVGGGYSGTLSGGDDVLYSFSISEFLGWDGTYASGSASFEDSNFVNPDNWSALFSELDSQPYAAMPLSIECGTTYSNYSGYGLDLATGWIVFFGVGDCYLDGRDDFPIPCEFDGTCSTPTPTPTPGPTSTPTPTPGQTPPPPLWTPHPQPTPLATIVPDVVVGDLEGSFSYDAQTGIGTISVNLKQDVEMVTIPDEVYNNELPDVDSKIPVNLGDERGTDDSGAVVDSLVGQADSVLESGKDTWFKPVVDSFLGVLFGHPFLEYFRTAADIQTSDSICSVSIDLFGSTITFGFCDLEDELALLKVVILVVATVYGAFIVMRGD